MRRKILIALMLTLPIFLNCDESPTAPKESFRGVVIDLNGNKSIYDNGEYFPITGIHENRFVYGCDVVQIDTTGGPFPSRTVYYENCREIDSCNVLTSAIPYIPCD